MYKLTTIKTFTYPHEAYVIRARLESEGIETFLQDEMTVQVHNFYSNAIGGVKLQVREKDVAQAMKILQFEPETNRDVLIVKKSEIADENTCPFCNSDNIAKGKKANLITFIPYLILGFCFPAYKKLFTCFDCEKQWILR